MADRLRRLAAVLLVRWHMRSCGRCQACLRAGTDAMVADLLSGVHG